MKVTAKAALEAVEVAHRRAQTVLGELEVDGVFGPKSQAREKKLRVLARLSPGALWIDDDPPPVEDKVDARSEKAIVTLLPQVQPYARRLVRECAAEGFKIIVLSGFRSYAEQQKLYDKYKAGGPKAAPPGHSGHNFGISFDIGVFKGADYLGESPLYKTAGRLGRAMGLHWGADFGDEPHFTKRPPTLEDRTESVMMAALRTRKASGSPFWP